MEDEGSKVTEVTTDASAALDAARLVWACLGARDEEAAVAAEESCMEAATARGLHAAGVVHSTFKESGYPTGKGSLNVSVLTCPVYPSTDAGACLAARRALWDDSEVPTVCHCSRALFVCCTGLLGVQARAVRRLGDLFTAAGDEEANAIAGLGFELGAMPTVVSMIKGESADSAGVFASTVAVERVRVQAATILGALATGAPAAAAETLVDAGACEAVAAMLCKPQPTGVNHVVHGAVRGAAAGAMAALCALDAAALERAATAAAAASGAGESKGEADGEGATASAQVDEDTVGLNKDGKRGVGVCAAFLASEYEVVGSLIGLVEDASYELDTADGAQIVSSGQAAVDALCKLAVVYSAETASRLEAIGGLSHIVLWSIGESRSGSISGLIQGLSRLLLSVLYGDPEAWKRHTEALEASGGAGGAGESAARTAPVQGMPSKAIERLVAIVADAELELNARSFAVASLRRLLVHFGTNAGPDGIDMLLKAYASEGLPFALLSFLASAPQASKAGAAAAVEPADGADSCWLLGALFLKVEGLAESVPIQPTAAVLFEWLTGERGAIGRQLAPTDAEDDGGAGKARVKRKARKGRAVAPAAAAAAGACAAFADQSPEAAAALVKLGVVEVVVDNLSDARRAASDPDLARGSLAVLRASLTSALSEAAPRAVDAGAAAILPHFVGHELLGPIAVRCRDELASATGDAERRARKAESELLQMVAEEESASRGGGKKSKQKGKAAAAGAAGAAGTTATQSALDDRLLGVLVSAAEPLSAADVAAAVAAASPGSPVLAADEVGDALARLRDRGVAARSKRGKWRHVPPS